MHFVEGGVCAAKGYTASGVHCGIRKNHSKKELKEEAVTLGRYRHFKGNEYEVIGFAKHSETEEKLVLYRSTQNPEEVWARPYDMFKEIITRDGKQVRRFTKLDN